MTALFCAFWKCENEFLFHISEKIQAKNIHACNHINLSLTVSWSSLLGPVFAINLWCLKLCHVDESWLFLMTWSNTHKTPWSSRQQGLFDSPPSKMIKGLGMVKRFFVLIGVKAEVSKLDLWVVIILCARVDPLPGLRINSGPTFNDRNPEKMGPNKKPYEIGLMSLFPIWK